MNFSLDRTVGAVDFGNVLFRLSFSDYHTALEDYTGVIDQDTLFYREVRPTTMPNRPSPEIRFRGCFICAI